MTFQGATITHNAEGWHGEDRCVAHTAGGAGSVSIRWRRQQRCDDHNAAKNLQLGDTGFKKACVLPKTAPIGAEPALQKSHLVSQVLGLLHGVVEKDAGTNTAAIPLH